jgi:TonB-linked SusC/RagA family outer membrane protein
MHVARWKVFAATALAIAFALLGSASAYAQASIAGRVTAQGTGEGLPEARVILVGTSLFGSTGPDGRFTLRNVPAGTHEVRVIRVGYQEQKKPITVATGETTALDFVLTPVVVRLQEVVTTATGETRRVELGNSIPSIDVAQLTQQAPIANMTDLLTARTAGVQVVGSSLTGAGAKIRIRGASSLNLANDPIYVIDGVRMTSNPGSVFFGTGGTSPSRVGDINPEEIENIEVVKGPSAATLYGTDAANGVIVITTKRGRAGNARWTFYGEGGLVQDRNTYPTNYTLLGRTPSTTGTPNAQRSCVLTEIVSKQCAPDSTVSLNVFGTDYISPVATGNRSQFGGQVSGGTDLVRYFVSGEGEHEIGTFALPQFERDRMRRQHLAIRDYMERPNALGKYSVRGNMNAAITPKLDVAVSTGFINLNQRFPMEANATAGIGSQAFGGPGYIDTTRKVSYPGGTTGEDAPLMGYRAYTPGQVFGESIDQTVNRFIGSSNWSWRPTSKLTGRANIGVDYTSRNDRRVRRRGEGSPLNATYRLGEIGAAGTSITNFSVDLGGTYTANPLEWLNVKSTAGAQYVDYNFNAHRGSGNDIAPGAQTSGAGANQVASEATTLSRTLGVFVEEAAALRDRLFLTGALRSDQNSAFGTEFQSVLYPKLSLSWIISDESFFPRYDWLNQFRFRSAYGASGRQPGPNDAIRFFAVSRDNVASTDVSTVQYSALGNTKLRPERATELETGFEARLFQRVNVDVTYYNKLTKDALISAVQPPSLGASTDIQSNLGSVKNVGWEGMVNAQLVNRPVVGWDITLSGSTNKNKLVSMGDLPPQVGATTRAQAGYPLFGYWARHYTYNDNDRNGIITVSELIVDDSSSFVASSQARHQGVLSTGIDLFNRTLRFQTLVDYKGGYKVLNGTERIRCQSRVNCEGTSQLGASLFQQARAVALREHGSQTQYGFMEDASFLRWREVSANVTLPERFASRFLRSRGGTLTLAARNLGLIWTPYTGTDPETDYQAGDSNDVPSDFQTISPPSYFILRLSLNF